MPKEALAHDFLNREPANRKSALRDLWEWANDRPRTITVNGRAVNLKRGQLGYAQTTLAKFWRWSPEKIKTVLGEFQDEGFITFEATPTTTIITVLDYTVYNPDTTPEPRAEPAAEPATETGTEPAAEPAQKLEVGRGKYEGGRETAPQFAEIPSNKEVAEFCDQHRNLAIGITAGIPATWWMDWLAFHLPPGRPLPHDWKRALLLSAEADWSNPCSAGFPKLHGLRLGEKKAPPNGQRQPGDQEWWWTAELAAVERACDGAFIAEDKKTGERLKEIVILRKAGR